MRKILVMAAAAALLGTGAGSALADPWPGEEGSPRRDRHAKRMKVEPTEHTRSKKKSASLSKLLRK